MANIYRFATTGGGESFGPTWGKLWPWDWGKIWPWSRF